MHCHPPRPELQDTVECGVVVRCPAGAVSRFPAMPRAMLSASVGQHGPGPVLFHAFSTRPFEHRHALPVWAFGLVLMPAAAAELLGLTTGVWVDAALPWSTIAGPAEAARLDEALALAPTDTARLRALQDSLQRVQVRARGAERVQRARREALQRLCTAVGAAGPQAAAELGWGGRQLERRCHALLGVAPKPWQRINRWHGLASQLLRRPGQPGVATALDAGYFDQSHSARDTRLLTGTTLRHLLQQAQPGGEWWALATARWLPPRLP